MLEMTAAAEVDGVKFDGVDIGLLDPHINIDSTDDDIKRLVGPVCGHRVVVSSRYASRLHHGEEAEEILTEIVNSTRVPL